MVMMTLEVVKDSYHLFNFVSQGDIGIPSTEKGDNNLIKLGGTQLVGKVYTGGNVTSIGNININNKNRTYSIYYTPYKYFRQ